MTPMGKVAVLDKHADKVRTELRALVNDDEKWSEAVAVARGRHVTGSYEHGDANLFEWSDGRVRAERLEELADWIVYSAWLFERAGPAECAHIYYTGSDQVIPEGAPCRQCGEPWRG